MTVQELINDLQLCNPDLPVFFACGETTGATIEAVEFRTHKVTDDPSEVEIGWGLSNPCAFIVNRASITDPCGDCGKQCDEPEAGYCWKCLAKVHQPKS